MSESVQILIEADDKASKTFAESAQAIAASQKKVEQVLKSIESPIDRYNQELTELQALHKSGSLSTQQFAAAQAKLTEKIKGNGNAFKEMGGKAKASTEFIGTLASLTGNSELASFAGQMAGVTEKVGQFSEVSKAGTAGALGFKLGLVGLVGTLSFGVGKAIGDVIFQTGKFERELQAAKDRAKELASAMANLQAVEFSNRKEDLGLIRDPEEKQAAQKQLLDELNRDITAVTQNVAKSKRVVEEWADAWQITPQRKETALMATEELKNDEARLAALKKQRDEMIQMTSVRVQENELIRQSNEAKDKSEAYLQTLQQEVEYLKATREEQIKLDAARNAVAGDRKEVERLLAERDAIIAKAEADKKADEDKKQRIEEMAKAEVDAREKVARAEEEKQKQNQEAAKKVRDEALADKKRVQDIIESENQRLKIKEIELTKGKEAAKVQSLIDQGVDEANAKAIAAKETSLGRLQSADVSPLNASESRLLTRGSGQSIPQQTLEEIRQLRIEARDAARERRDADREKREIERNKPKVVVAGAPV